MRKSEIDVRGHTSGQFKTFCPLCHEGRAHQGDPSLSVNLDSGVYDCHNCGENGKLTDVIPTAAFGTNTNKKYKAPDTAELAKYDETLDDLVLDYFHGRGITDEVLAATKVSYGPSFRVPDPTNPQRGLILDGIPQYDRAIRFPFFENGKLVWIKHLRPKEWCEDGYRKIRAFKDGKPVPFGFDNAGDRIFIFEGEIDAMSGLVAGVPECWSVPSGAKGFVWLSFDSVVEKLAAAKHVYLALDQDADGREMRDELIRRLSELHGGAERLMLVSFPEDCKDANDVLVKYGPERLRWCLEEDAQPVPIEGISEVMEFGEQFMEYYYNGLPKGKSTGIPSLDEIYRIMPGMVTVVSGVTNYGKSELMDEIVRLQIEQHGDKFAFYTPENAPEALHMIKVAEKYIGKPFDIERFGAMSPEEAQHALEWMNEHMFYINPRNKTYSIDEILERARVLIYREGIRGLIIDPWNYVRKDFGALREDQFINEAMQKIGVFAKATQVHVWLIVHPRTLTKDKATGKMEVPNIHQLSGGSKFGDNTDFFLVIHRDPIMAYKTGIHEVVVYCQKSRYRPAARQGNVSLEWEPFNGRFRALGEAAIAPPVEDFVGVADNDDGF